MPNKQRIYLATGNLHKVHEFQKLAEASKMDIEFVRSEKMPAVVEDTGTFIGNARKKALALKAILPANSWVLSDDSGLCVDALEGAPGVESAYFAGPVGDSKANVLKLIDVMRGVPPEKRSARFVCVLVLLSPSEAGDVFFEGRCEGILADGVTGANGFGYDPLFIPESQVKTFADLGDELKGKISHRGRAFSSFVSWWKSSGREPL